jgi:hypothetical protein
MAQRVSRTAAVKAFCVWCMGGNLLDAQKCQERACPLWPLSWPGTRSKVHSGNLGATKTRGVG